ncbi:MAG: glycosyltransferase family 39 protein, partial [Anaerolineae bacterium]|nr:glycosyltransferase family 39 protein [Anaerolineae bacterium]
MNVSMAKDVSIDMNTAYRRWLRLILAVFLLLCGLNNITLPMFEASDEAAHFAYADYWARERRLPNLRQEVPSHEAFQPPLYYVALAPLIRLFDRSNLAEISQLNPDWFDRELNADYASVAQLHLHGPAEQFPYRGAVWAVRAARFASSLLGAATIYTLFLLAQLILRQQKHAKTIGLLAAALAAFNPKFIHISSIVSNDIAVTFAATLACWWMLRIEAEADDNPQWASWFGLGILIGLAGLCKIQAFALVIPAGVLWLSSLTFSEKSKIQNLNSKIIQPVCAAAGFLLVSAWWFWLNWGRYGAPLAWNEVQTANAALLRPQPLGVGEMISRVPQLFISFWGVLGIEKYFPPWVNWVLFGGLVLAVLGCGRLVSLRWGTWSHARAWLVMLARQMRALALLLGWMRTQVGPEHSR